MTLHDNAINIIKNQIAIIDEDIKNLGESIQTMEDRIAQLIGHKKIQLVRLESLQVTMDALIKLMAQRERWTEKEQTQAEVEVFILDHIFSALPTPPFTEYEKQAVAKRVYEHVWQQSVSGNFGLAA